MGWLSSTLSEKIISWQTFSPRNYQERDLNFFSTSLTSKRLQLQLQDALKKTQLYIIYKVYLEILMHYSLYNAFITTTNASEIYIQQFWYTITYDLTSKAFFFTMGDKVFKVNVDLLRNTLSITPKDLDQPFILPAPEKEIISFINQLGCSKTIRTISALKVNDMYQPWRTLLTMLNKCLTGKATASDRPRLPMLQLTVRNGHRHNVDFADLIWEEFKYQIESRRISRQKQELMPFSRFTKLIVKYILSKHDQISKRPFSFHHVIKFDSTLGNLKFVNKGCKEPIFGMALPIMMLNDDINASCKVFRRFGISLESCARDNEPAGDAQVDVQMTEAQPEKPEATLISSHQTLSSAEFTSQFLNDNPHITVNDMLKDPVEPEFQSMVDILVTQEKPTEPKPLLVDTTITLIPDTKTISLTQPPQTQTKRIKTKVILKKSNKPDSQVESGELECRVTRLEKKVHAMSSFNLPEAIDNSVKAHLKNVLPKDVPYCGKIKLEKAKKSMPKNSSTPVDQAALDEFEEKD
ncbi:hypothetical protein Tco_0285774 [Tanacetum coccineum]